MDARTPAAAALLSVLILGAAWAPAHAQYTGSPVSEEDRENMERLRSRVPMETDAAGPGTQYSDAAAAAAALAAAWAVFAAGGAGAATLLPRRRPGR